MQPRLLLRARQAGGACLASYAKIETLSACVITLLNAANCFLDLVRRPRGLPPALIQLTHFLAQRWRTTSEVGLVHGEENSSL